VFNRGSTLTQLPEGVEQITGDRHSLRDFTSRFRALAPSVVIDMCAYNESEAALLMDVFNGIARRVVVVSSMDVYRGWDRFFNRDTSADIQVSPFTEESPLRERFYPKREQAPDASDWRYDYEKILVERAVSKYPDLPSTILRLASIYGPGDPQRRLFDTLKRMDDKRPAILLDEAKAKWRWTWGYVENAAQAIVLATTDRRAENRIYNIGEEQARTQEEWIQALARITGWNGRLLVVNESELPAHLQDSGPVDFRQDLASHSGKIRRELNYTEMVSFDDGLARTVDWLRKNPPLNIDPKEFDYEAEDACLRRLVESKDINNSFGGGTVMQKLG
jgi:nucleoside-diphosphate-sugar epimerase